MTNQTRLNHPHSRHLANNSLIVQFLLHELYHAAKTLLRYQSLLSKIHLTPHKKYTKPGREHLYEAFDSIALLAGGTNQHMRIFTWNLNEGIIAKLKQYATLFANNLDPKDTHAVQLEKHAERAWTDCLECLDQTREQIKLPSKEPANLNILVSNATKLHIRIKKISQILAGILPQFRDDETVLYYLLRNQNDLSKLWGNSFLPDLFLQLFPNGKEEVECFLHSRYNKRHFTHVIQNLTQTIYQLFTHV